MADQIVIHATSEMYATGAALTDEHRATLTAKADRCRAITETDEQFAYPIPVIHPVTNEHLGDLVCYF